jgi:hypothetical protein
MSLIAYKMKKIKKKFTNPNFTSASAKFWSMEIWKMKR